MTFGHLDHILREKGEKEKPILTERSGVISTRQLHVLQGFSLFMRCHDFVPRIRDTNRGDHGKGEMAAEPVEMEQVSEIQTCLAATALGFNLLRGGLDFGPNLKAEASCRRPPKYNKPNKY